MLAPNCREWRSPAWPNKQRREPQMVCIILLFSAKPILEQYLHSPDAKLSFNRWCCSERINHLCLLSHCAGTPTGRPAVCWKRMPAPPHLLLINLKAVGWSDSSCPFPCWTAALDHLVGSLSSPSLNLCAYRALPKSPDTALQPRDTWFGRTQKLDLLN